MTRWRGWLTAGVAAGFAVLSLDPGRAATVSYTYDALGRLLSASYGNGVTVTYAYDAAGNRTQYSTTAEPLPTAPSFSQTVGYNTAGNTIPLSLGGGPATSVAITAGPRAGATATVNGVTSITYSPPSNYAGGDSLTYTASNAAGTSSPGVITITVSAAIPVANGVSASVLFNSSSNPITPNLAGGVATSVAISTRPSNGVATASGTSISYTPTTGYSGSDSFAYTASNAAGTSAPATVNITITIPNGTVLVTKNTAGPFSYTIPAGVAFITIEGWGSGAPGRLLSVLGSPFSMGGGGGGYFSKHLAVTAGQVITGSIPTTTPPGGVGTIPATAAPTTIASPALTANSAAATIGGTASGGDTNTTGDGCCATNSTEGGGAGNGGGDQNTPGAAGTAPGGGGAGSTTSGLGAGANGQIRITARTS